MRLEVYDLAGRLGHWAPRTQVLELFLNTDGGDLDRADYAGVYVLADALRIAPGRVDLATLAVARRVARDAAPNSNIVFIACDAGLKYFSAGLGDGNLDEMDDALEGDVFWW